MRCPDLTNTYDEVEFMSDDTTGEVYSLVRLQRLCERIGEIYTNNKDNHPNSLLAELAAQAYLNGLEEWKMLTPDFIRSKG